MDVKDVIKSMMKENTGTNFLDSGGAYGRHWQRNQERDFDSEPEVSVDMDWLGEGDDIVPTINLYKFLTLKLDTDEVCDEFNTLFENMEDWDGDTYGCSKAASDWLKEKGYEVDQDRAVNSYNGESALSQVIQYTPVYPCYTLLQIHQGCDVRGGYTDAKLFVTDEYLDESVIGTVTYKDGRVVNVDTMYNGYCLTDEEGNRIKYEDGMTIDLFLCE